MGESRRWREEREENVVGWGAATRFSAVKQAIANTTGAGSVKLWNQKTPNRIPYVKQKNRGAPLRVRRGFSSNLPPIATVESLREERGSDCAKR